MTIPLTEQTVIEYVRSVDALAALFEGADELQSSQIAEGNINLIFRVSNTRDPLQQSVLVKQALPYSWRYPDFKMPVERMQIEHEVLQIERNYCPDNVPVVYWYDTDRHIQVIEDLNRHLVMREGLMQQQRYPLVAQHIGSFMARTLFYT